MSIFMFHLLFFHILIKKESYYYVLCLQVLSLMISAFAHQAEGKGSNPHFQMDTPVRQSFHLYTGDRMTVKMKMMADRGNLQLNVGFQPQWDQQFSFFQMLETITTHRKPNIGFNLEPEIFCRKILTLVLSAALISDVMIQPQNTYHLQLNQYNMLQLSHSFLDMSFYILTFCFNFI